MVFDYTELSAKQMTDVVYARAYAKVDGVDYYSDVNKYSILQYAYNKLATSSDEELKELLTNMLAYGATAQKYFDYKEDRLPTADWYQIKVVGGRLDDGSSAGLYLSGEKVTLTAPDTDADGKTFSHWVDDSDNWVVDEVIVGSQNAVYTPVYVELQIASEGLSFKSNGDGTCYVSGMGTCTDTAIVIPAISPTGERVISIGERAFGWKYEVISIVIPDSITSIGDAAFYCCRGLTAVTIGEGVTSIGSQAFSGCTGLTSVIIPSSVIRIGFSAFGTCTSLESITFNDTSTWYRTDETYYWNNMIGGQYESVTNSSENAKKFGWSYAWYKK
ncbi:MAG: leucine-rich repeat domain-containing protein [Clostridia bacterium]|nr:leucine-rich repeat domain-containing protein [Clostridia bacterium]